ncbi:MAG: tRNA adenosine(34) deaminase TadA [Deltaproteobacteria bacterium]|nr:tRNA adenosine(34) deaminase TadA [Deltaproteobacteria bacterium]
MSYNDEKFMDIAIEEALLASAKGEIPVGAVVTLGDNILARSHNNAISMNDPSAHAEILAIRQAATTVGNYRLIGTTLYVTLEPCIMCAGSIIQARIQRVVFGADDPKGGGVVSLYGILDDKRLNHSVEVKSGVKKDACAEILSRFFREKRIVGNAKS